MVRPRRTLIIECIPQNEGKDEGLLLYHFLRMRMPRSVDYKVMRGKNDLMSFLEKEGKRYSLVHFSSHGHKEGYFSLARGFMIPEEFPPGCFKGSEVTFSSCEVGRAGFMDELQTRTQMSVAVAPLNKIEYIDAAAFFVNYYYFRCHKRYSARSSYAKAMSSLKQSIKGGFRFFEWR
ncbi:MAG: hypothetical protein QW520_03130 [Methanomassiliicoccales archaeon]